MPIKPISKPGLNRVSYSVPLTLSHPLHHRWEKRTPAYHYLALSVYGDRAGIEINQN
jgi:hypothetical protein